MSVSVRHRVALWMAVLAMSGAVFHDAAAFFPFGGSSTVELQLRLIRWQFSDFDRNRDGVVGGPSDGLDITFEGGPLGWTNEEMAILEESFHVWEDVPTSYVAFRFTLPIEDPVEVLGGLGSPVLQVDGINLVAIQLPEDPLREPAVDAPGVLGIANIDFLIDDAFFESPDGTVIVPVSGGRIFECDIVIDGPAHRPPAPGVAPLADLKGTMVHEIGHLLGLGHNPMNNLVLIPETGELIESPVIYWPDAAGVLERVGVTPTMFPSVFLLDDPVFGLIDGGSDLAVDDIAGVTFLYPRANQDRFFGITHRARTFARPGLPTTPILGGLVTAWADVDNDPATPRVPVVSTMTGLYQHNTQILDRGEFRLLGLPKELEHIGLPDPFEATYTLTIEPLSGARLPFQGPDAFDSTHIFQGPWPLPYNLAFPSEVFHVDGSFFGRDNFEGGTPLMFDQRRGRVVNAVTGQTLNNMLPRGFPMFGERSEVCPLLVVQQAAGVTIAPAFLRKVRDNYLFSTAIGAAAVDVYYQTGPAIVALLLKHESLLAASAHAMRAFEFILIHYRTALVAIFLIVGTLLWRNRGFRKLLRVGAAGIVALTLALTIYQGLAFAAVQFMTEAQRAQAADAIVQGRVVEVESRLRRHGNSIETITVLSVDDELKGSLNKGSTIDVRLPGGRVGNFTTVTTEMPRFQPGEEVLLYLYFVEGHGFVVVGGFQGKTTIFTKEDTGEKYVIGSTFLTEEEAIAQGKSLDEEITVTKDEEGRTPLEDLKAALRKVLREQQNP